MKFVRSCLALVFGFFLMIMLMIFLMMMMTNAMLSSIPEVTMPT